ncbi:MAG: efflux RND transporter permease subunit, partial [Sulfurimonas sp.]|nr:efflux RND transporter permease subunit [Sulfurimonas sp.]
MSIIDSAFNRTRVVMLVFIMILVAGTFAYISIPKESEPDVPIPTFIVSISHEGISPEDAERLLVKPMEKELQSLDGLKEMRSVAGEGYASITLEFHAGYDIDKALIDVREKVSITTPNLPPDTDEPRVMEINVALFPVISVSLSGRLPEQELVSIAKRLKEDLEALSGVLEVQIGGDREEMMEVVLNPSVMQAYNITYDDIANFLKLNNRLVPAGALDIGAGHMVMKVPGVIENIKDVLNLPIKTVDGVVVTFNDVATVRRAYKDPTGFARVDEKPALVLEVTKRLGANIIETIEDVRRIIESKRQQWPKTLEVNYMQDKSESVKTMLGDLQNNVITAIILVMIVAVAAMGLRPAILVGMAIPGSFLAGILALQAMDYTMNIVVLFSLILSVGMLVDGAIVTIELADRKIAEGMQRKQAYAYGAKRMSWPIIASTATTLSVFIPLIFWPGVVGEFMKFLPITVLLTLLASMFMALIFIPVLGGIIGNKKVADVGASEAISAAEDGSLDNIKGATGIYIAAIKPLLRHPGKVFGFATIFLFLSYAAYISFGRGVEFFPKMEPDFIQVQVLARGDLSVYEKDKLVRRVEKKLLGMDVYKTIYSRTFSDVSNQQNMPLDMIGIIQLEFIDWKKRPPASEIIEDVRKRLKSVAGIMAEVRQQESGPSAGKPVQIEIRSSDSEKLRGTVEKLRELMNKTGGFVDVEDSRTLPGIGWRLEINREQAARYGVDVTSIGNTVQMLTTGLKVGEYQPDDAE